MNKTDWLAILGLIGCVLLVVEIQLYILYKGLLGLMKALIGDKPDVE